MSETNKNLINGFDTSYSRIIPQHGTEQYFNTTYINTETGDITNEVPSDGSKYQLLSQYITPKPGEIIIFDPDENYNYSRFKIGKTIIESSEDGTSTERLATLDELEFSSGAANGKGQNSLQVGQVGDYPTEALGDYSIAVGYNKGKVPTQSVGIASAAIGRGIQTYGRMSFGIGADSFTGLSEDNKRLLRHGVGFLLKNEEENELINKYELQINKLKEQKGSTTDSDLINKYESQITELEFAIEKIDFNNYFKDLPTIQNLSSPYNIYKKKSDGNFDKIYENFDGKIFGDKNYRISNEYYYGTDSTKIQLNTKITQTTFAYEFPNVDIDIIHDNKTRTITVCPYAPDFYTDEELQTGDIFYNFGNNAIVAGWDSNAVGESSYVFGNGNIAMGKNSFITGNGSKTYSYGNVSLGEQNVIGNSEDTDFGHRTKEAQNIIAIGTGLKSKTANQIVLGKYNKQDDNALLVIGNNSNNLLTLSNTQLNYGDLIELKMGSNQNIKCVIVEDQYQGHEVTFENDINEIVNKTDKIFVEKIDKMTPSKTIYFKELIISENSKTSQDKKKIRIKFEGVDENITENGSLLNIESFTYKFYLPLLYISNTSKSDAADGRHQHRLFYQGDVQLQRNFYINKENNRIFEVNDTNVISNLPVEINNDLNVNDILLVNKTSSTIYEYKDITTKLSDSIIKEYLIKFNEQHELQTSEKVVINQQYWCDIEKSEQNYCFYNIVASSPSLPNNIKIETIYLIKSNTITQPSISLNGNLKVNFNADYLTFSLTDFNSIGGEK